MIALFYDRKNKATVRSDQLVRINLVAALVQVEEQDSKNLTWEELHEEEGRLHFMPHQLGEVGYKSEDCAPYQNWDRFCMVSDLVFIDLITE